MKKGDMFEAVVETIDFPNKGMLYVDGERVIVKNAIPGQKIRFVINKKRNGKCEARLLEVLEKSPLEREQKMPARILEFAEAACIRAFRMRNS